MAGQSFKDSHAPWDRMPGVSRLFLDYVSRWSSVSPFYGHSCDIDSVAAFAGICPRPGREALDQLCDALGEQQDRWESSRAGIARLRAGAVAVITGQQAGLFTGPLYAVYKAITAIRLARALDQRGIPAVPVFWIAAEDHDHDEIRWASVLDREGAPRRFQIDLDGAEAAPVGWTRYPDSIRGAVAELFACLPDSEFVPEVREIVESVYAPGVSPVDAFARLLARLFAGAGLTLVDPLDPAIKRLARPALERAVEKNRDIRAAIRRRGQEIVAAGYHEQVRVGDDFSGLFAYEGETRRVLKPGELGTGKTLSPNVLLRPVVQDSIFPTAAYVGGPAEIAYFAQAAAAYQVFDRPMPPVVPRISATLVEARVARAIEAYGLERADAWQGREFLSRKAGQTLEGSAAFDRVRETVSVQLGALRPMLESVDPTLAGALDTSMQKMLHHVDGLRAKYVSAEAKRSQIMDRRLDAIVNSLYPDRKLQEREVNIVSFVSRYGMGAIQRIDARLSLDFKGHQFAGIE